MELLVKDKKFYRKFLAIALPIAFQNFITTSLNMIDTFMISSLSVASISGVGTANKVFFLLNLVLFGTSSGSAIFAAQYWGKKDIKNIKRLLGITLIIGTFASLLFTIAALVLPDVVMRIFIPDDEEVIREGIRYLRIIGISYIATAITFSYVFLLRSVNEVKIPMVITIISIGINTALNWVLIYGNLGFPELGVQGAAIATVIARFFECSVLLTVVYRKRLPVAAKFNEMVDISKSFILKYFRTVLPVIGNETMWALGVTIYSMVYGRMGKEALASITITQTIEQMAMVLFFGAASATAVILGNVIGAGHLSKAFKQAKSIFIITFGLSLIISVIVWGIAPYIAGIFDVSPEVTNNIVLCLKVFSLYVPFKTFNTINVVGVLRSGGDTKFTMILDTGCVWLIGIPLGALGGLILHLDIQYVYAMVLLEEFFKMFFGIYRVKSKKWINNLVSET